MFRSSQLRAALAVVVLFLGCMKARQREYAVYPVDGQLFVGGHPATGANVTFHPLVLDHEMGSFSATVKEDGHFVPIQVDGAVGLPQGEYALTVIWEDDALDDQFAGKYADVDRPVVRIRVSQSINLIPKIQLPALENEMRSPFGRADNKY